MNEFFLQVLALSGVGSQSATGHQVLSLSVLFEDGGSWQSAKRRIALFKSNFPRIAGWRDRWSTGTTVPRCPSASPTATSKSTGGASHALKNFKAESLVLVGSVGSVFMRASFRRIQWRNAAGRSTSFAEGDSIFSMHAAVPDTAL